MRHIRGNHDKVASGVEEGLGFNPVALAAARWTQRRLSEVNRRFVASLPPGPVQENGFLYAHGSPLDEDAYIFSERDAAEVFRQTTFDVCFFGHTHIAGCFMHREGVTHVAARAARDDRARAGRALPDQPGRGGSAARSRPARGVRDLRQRAAAGAVVPRRLSGGRAQAADTRAGLPKVLADRLSMGA